MRGGVVTERQLHRDSGHFWDGGQNSRLIKNGLGKRDLVVPQNDLKEIITQVRRDTCLAQHDLGKELLRGNNPVFSTEDCLSKSWWSYGVEIMMPLKMNR